MGNAPLLNMDLLPQIGELVVEKYRVLRLLGSGGMGSVLEARHAALGHSVALKILHQPATEGDEASMRFFREARATASLESEHVVRIFDLGTTEQGLPFLVMERLSGFDLGDVLMRIGTFPPSLAVECVLQATRGVIQAHEAGIVHRDLKPSNLFLTRRADGRPLVKVLDFGISKLKSEESVRLTQTRTVVGSPLYMSPEQVRDARQVDVRTDVWSLGAILYELLSGRPAFDGDTLPSVYASIVTDEPAPIDRDDVPSGLEQLVLRCLAKERSERVSSAEELGHALEALALTLPPPPLATLDLPFPSRERDEEPRSFQSFPGSRPSGETRNAEVIRTSATRKRLTPGASPTLSSGDAVTAPKGRRWLLWAGLGCLVAALAIVGAGLLRPAAQPADTPPIEVPRSFVLDIDSTPAGALVLEQGRVLGRTPLRLPMRASESDLRELVLQAEGYLPHVARVEPLKEDRTLAVALVPAPPPVPTPAAVRSAAPEGDGPEDAAPEGAAAERAKPAPRRPTSASRPSRGPAASAAEAPGQGEIHLSR